MLEKGSRYGEVMKRRKQAISFRPVQNRIYFFVLFGMEFPILIVDQDSMNLNKVIESKHAEAITTNNVAKSTKN